MHAKAAFAEEEARKISERTKAAPAMAKARDVKLGTPRNLTDDARRKGRAKMQARAAGLSLSATAERVGVSPMYVSLLLNRDAARPHA